MLCLMLQDWEIYVPTELMGQAAETLQSEPYATRYRLVKPWPYYSPCPLIHTYNRFKSRGINHYFFVIPSIDMHIDCHPSNFTRSPRGLPYPKLDVFIQSCLDTNDLLPFINVILEGMITISEPAQSSAIRRHSNSSIGILDRLPLEVLHWALNLLDFQSLSRFSHASLQAKRVVESLPLYRDFMEHAPQTLKALERTDLLHVHSAAALLDTLQSEACVSCGEYGAFLSLLTCERCCYECLRQNHALWAIPINQAKKCFGLDINHLKQIPILHSIPGVYSVRRVSRSRIQRLVNVKEAKKLAVVKHGSMENLDNLVVPPIRDTNSKALREFCLFQWLRKAPLQPLNLDLSKLPTEQNTPSDDHHGMASIPFPSLMNHVLENGLWCSGCEWMFRCYRLGKLPSNIASDLVPADVNPFWVLHVRQNRALSRADFLRHVHHCYGARELVAKLASSAISGNS